MSGHKIKKQIIELRLKSQKGSFHLQSLAGRIYREKTLPVIEKYFDLFGAPDTVHRLERLELDLGKISPKRLAEEFPRKVEEKLPDELRKRIAESREKKEKETESAFPEKSDLPAGEAQPRKNAERAAPVADSGYNDAEASPGATEQSAAAAAEPQNEETQKKQKNNKTEALYYFLKTGELPWWSEKLEPEELENIFQSLIAQESASAKTLLRALPKDRKLFQRLTRQFSDRLLGNLAALLEGAESGPISKLAAEVSAFFQEEDSKNAADKDKARFYLWLAVFSVLAENSGRLKAEETLRRVEMGFQNSPIEDDSGLKSELSRILRKSYAEKDDLANFVDPARRASPVAVYLRKSLEKLLTEPDFRQVFQTAFIGEDYFSKIEKKARRFFLVADSSQTRNADQKNAGLEEQGSKIEKKTRRTSNFTDSQQTKNADQKNPLKENEIIEELGFVVSQLERLALADIPRKYQKDIAFIAGLWKRLKNDKIMDAEESVASDPSEVAADSRGGRTACGKASAAEILDRGISDFSRSDEIYVNNSGLVLFGPYLKRFFESLGLMENQSFLDFSSAERSALLLQYLVDGSIEGSEAGLLLNKLLCGLDPEEPLSRKLEISAEEERAAKTLSQTLLQHWGIADSLSPEGLRPAFLQRKGILKTRDADWLLRVEKKTHDILLDKLPWSVNVVKLPWMERIIFAEW